MNTRRSRWGFNRFDLQLNAKTKKSEINSNLFNIFFDSGAPVLSSSGVGALERRQCFKFNISTMTTDCKSGPDIIHDLGEEVKDYFESSLLSAD